MIIKAFENETVNFENTGSAGEREQFGLKYPKLIHVSKSGIKFRQPGVFQIGTAGPTIVVYPAFFKNNEELLKTSQNGHIRSWFELIAGFVNTLEDSYLTASFDDGGDEWEPIVFSILALTELFVKEELDQVFFTQETTSSRSISGKWNIGKDLRSAPMPTKFTCVKNSFKNENNLLKLLKGILVNMLGSVNSRANSNMIESLLSKLEHMEPLCLTESSFLTVCKDIENHKNVIEWSAILDFFYQVLILRTDNYSGAGVAIRFPMDTFFEKLIEAIFEKMGYSTQKQYSMELLGGGTWIDQNEEAEVYANMKSRPDLILKTESFTKIIEIKYKPYTLPTLDTAGINRKSFGRNDRNQILSFILSYLSKPFEKPSQFFVVYPKSNTRTLETSKLVFKNATLSVEPDFSSLNVHQKPPLSPIEITFVALNVVKALDYLHGHGCPSFEQDLESWLATTDEAA